jgi:hypothetical protein
VLITYVGPHDGVEIRLPDGATVAVCQRGHDVDVPEAEALRLLEQPSNWQPATTPAPAPARKGGKPADDTADTAEED